MLSIFFRTTINRGQAPRLILMALFASLFFFVVTSSGRSQNLQHKSSTAASSQSITISQCRIELIDTVKLACERAGVLDLVAQEGQQVNKGEVVARVRDTLARMALTIAEKRAGNDVEIRYAQKAQELEELKYLRSLKANKEFSGTVSDLDLREQRLSAEKALLLLEQSRNERAINILRRDEADQQLKLHHVEAPIDGMVREIKKRTGESTTAGETILELVNTDRMRVVASVPLVDVSDIKTGDQVTIQVNVPSRRQNRKPVRLRGRITFIDARFEPLSKTVKCWAEVANPDGILRDGMTATMTVHYARSLAAGQPDFSEAVHFFERNSSRPETAR